MNVSPRDILQLDARLVYAGGLLGSVVGAGSHSFDATFQSGNAHSVSQGGAGGLDLRFVSCGCGKADNSNRDEFFFLSFLEGRPKQSKQTC